MREMVRQVQITTSSSNVVYLKHRTDSYIKDFRPNVTTQGQPEFCATKKATTSGIQVLVSPCAICYIWHMRLIL